MKTYLFAGEYFSKYADTYDNQERSKSLCWNWIKDNMIEQINKSDVVLDIGTGTGWMSFEIMKKHRNSFIIGVDVSKKMMSIAKNKNTFKNIQFVVSPAEMLSFKKDSFDVVVSLFTWEHISDQKNVIDNIYNILKPEGKFILGTNFKSDDEYDKEMEKFSKTNKKLAYKLWTDWNRMIEKIKKVSGGAYYREHPKHYEQYYYETLNQMKKAGFSDVRLLPTFNRIFGVFVGQKAFK